MVNPSAGQSNTIDAAITNKAIDASPYHLHPSIHLGLIFVKHPLSESGENYFNIEAQFYECTPVQKQSMFCEWNN